MHRILTNLKFSYEKWLKIGVRKLALLQLDVSFKTNLYVTQDKKIMIPLFISTKRELIKIMYY